MISTVPYILFWWIYFILIRFSSGSRGGGNGVMPPQACKNRPKKDDHRMWQLIFYVCCPPPPLRSFWIRCCALSIGFTLITLLYAHDSLIRLKITIQRKLYIESLSYRVEKTTSTFFIYKGLGNKSA